MRKIFLGFLMPLFVFLFASQKSLAIDPGYLAGQNHNYSVTFRGNGEAIVAARMVFLNSTDKPISSIRFRVPRVDPKDIIAFQAVGGSGCALNEPVPLSESREQKLLYPIPCETNLDPGFFGGGYGVKYLKTETGLKNDTIMIALPQPIKPGANGNFILYYRAFGYAKKNLFRSYDFTFETLKVEDRIGSVRVGITTDSDLVLRGTKSKVNYRFEEGALALKSGVASPEMDAQLNQLAQQIGQGEIIKDASNLQPLDSFSVKGSFADSRLKLYAKEIIISLLLILAVLLLLVRIGKKVFGMKVKKSPLFISLGVSFLAAFLMVAYTLALVFISNSVLLSPIYGTGFLMTIMVTLISIGAYGLLLIAPAVITGAKQGLLWGLSTFGLTIFWLIVDGIVIILVLLIIGGRGYSYPIPIPMMGGGSETQSLPATESLPAPANVDLQK